MVLARSEGAPMREDPIADEFIHDALVLEYGFRHRSEVLIQERDQLHRRRSLGERREVTHVTEEDSELAFFASEVHIVDVLEHVIHQLRCNVAIEGAAGTAKLASGGGVTHGPARNVRNS